MALSGKSRRARRKELERKLKKRAEELQEVDKRQDRTAVAIRYDIDKDAAPVVLAAGKGPVAEEILRIAEENKIPLFEDRKLAQLLSRIEIDTEVPPELTAKYVETGPLGHGALYMPAAASMAYGVGANDLVKYSAAMSYLYCAATKTLSQVEIFAPKDTGDAALNAVLGKLSCVKKEVPKNKK